MHNQDAVFGVDFAGTIKARVVERIYFDERWNIVRPGDRGLVGLLGMVNVRPEAEAGSGEETAAKAALALVHPLTGDEVMPQLQDPVCIGICVGGGIVFQEPVEDGRTWAVYPLEATGLLVD